MTGVRAVQATLAVAWASLYVATGFTTPLVCNKARGLALLSSFSTRTASSPVQQARGSRGLSALQATGGEDDGIDEYKRQMEEFMAQAHEKRLEAMEAVKAEVQRGYEDQIAELQAKLSTLPTAATGTAVNGANGDIAVTPSRTAELVSVAAPASVRSAAGPVHPAYAARTNRPGWEARWGPEEPSRSSTISAADVSAMEARAEGVASAGGKVNTAYAARSTRPGWEERWGDEEAARVGSATSSTVQGDVHPAYAARAHRPGWESRWGDEEVSRAAGGASSVADRGAPPVAAGGATSVDAGGATSVDAGRDVHPAYAARMQRAGWEERWGPEEPARAAGVSTPSLDLPATTTLAQEGATAADHHPAYSARLQRPGWETRWGDEEKNRVAEEPAGAVAVAGSSAGFAAAGGLDAKAEDVATAPDAPVAAPVVGADGGAAAGGGAAAADTFSVQLSPDDPLRDNLLPDDVAELKSMVVSYRGHFQDYLIKSLEANNDLKGTNAKLNAELSNAKEKLASEYELRESLQSNFLEYMSRSGDAGANAKSRVDQLEAEVVQLTAKAEELQRFAQEYMVKASSDKLKATEDAAAATQIESAARIAALQAQVLALQAGA